MARSTLEPLILATLTENTAIRFTACRDGDVEFEIGGHQEGLNLIATEPGVRKLRDACTEALRDLDARYGPAADGGR